MTRSPVNAQGVAESAALASPDPGDHTVIATFVPDAGFSGSGDIITQTVAAAGVDLDVASSAPSSTYGQGVSFTATVGSQQLGTGDPTGFVQFVVDGQPLGDAVELTRRPGHQLDGVGPAARAHTRVRRLLR